METRLVAEINHKQNNKGQKYYELFIGNDAYTFETLKEILEFLPNTVKFYEECYRIDKLTAR